APAPVFAAAMQPAAPRSFPGTGRPLGEPAGESVGQCRTGRTWPANADHIGPAPEATGTRGSAQRRVSPALSPGPSQLPTLIDTRFVAIVREKMSRPGSRFGH